MQMAIRFTSSQLPDVLGPHDLSRMATGVGQLGPLVIKHGEVDNPSILDDDPVAGIIVSSFLVLIKWDCP